MPKHDSLSKPSGPKMKKVKLMLPVNSNSNQHKDGMDDTNPSMPEDIEMDDINSQIAWSPMPNTDGLVNDKIDSTAPAVQAGSKMTQAPAEGSKNSESTQMVVTTANGYNPWVDIVNAIPKLCHVKTLDSNMEYGEDHIQVYDWVSRFQNDFPHLMMLAFIPSMPHLTNLALGNPSDFKYDNKRITGAYTYPQSFFMLSSVTFSSLFKGNFNCAIAIKPLALFWPHQASVLAEIMGIDFKCNLLSFKTVQDSLMFTTYPKPKDPSTPPLPSKACINSKTFRPAVQPWNKDIPLYDAVATAAYLRV
ncbi:uncharacterized protein EV420DRAFT_1649936 [Desarmillaria tabescens]|uniref:Uncharacterized protein n=1 Tax=Armillaria tabescens TaxID=1929756 RepID=A0AA39JFL0_ARMTA|nr:uncharacterized protein EV420DRAFT_1649936 [Desarmillaria tabescens]KAK0441713.1 hypothetical protein EV420DRAFT_1649936 [Desarmillaria tabescens]